MPDSFATPWTIVQGLPGGSVGGASSTGDSVAQPCSTGDSGLIPGWGRSLDEGVATHSSWTESLVGYSLLLLPLSHLSRVWLCATHRRQPTRLLRPWDSPGKSTGVGCHCLLPVQESEMWKWRRSVVSDSVRPHGLQPTRLLRPWDSPGKSTGVGCHRLLRGHSL